jgi:uncharacterized protein (TIGR02466 family)
MNSAIINTLFPIAVYDKKLDRDISEKEKEQIYDLSKNTVNNKNNICTSGVDVLKLSSLYSIKNFINSCLNEYVNNVIKPKHNLKLQITESWVNYNNKNQSHHRHYHKNSIISGVFYFNCIENDEIIFYNKLDQFSSFEPEVLEYTNLNSNSWNYPVCKNKLLLFPSYLEHSVSENNEEKTRISLSFNTMFDGLISSHNSQRLKI